MWHEARRSEKRVHEMMDAAKKRAERRADQRSRRAGDPTQLLRVAGTKLRLAHDSAVYQSAQDLSGLSVTPYPSSRLLQRLTEACLGPPIPSLDSPHAMASSPDRHTP
ncbi:unnamed protein product [Closterium sp. NIES-54]